MGYMWAGFSILTWCIGLAIIMVLCFQDRFLPFFQDLLHWSGWQIIAKLSYAAYLIHTCVLILNFCQLDSPIHYAFGTFFYNFFAFVLLSLFSACVLWLFIEKPLANLQMQLLGGGGD